MDRRQSLLGSLRGKLSRKKGDSKTDRSPFEAAPATRRPDRTGVNPFTSPSNEPPPSYTPYQAPASQQMPPSSIPTGSSGSSSTPIPPERNPARVDCSSLSASGVPADDLYSFLSTFDTAFLIDDSGSMAGRSWRECSAALEAITPICTAHDSDGVDIWFLNAKDAPVHHNVTLASTVHEIFTTVRPQGGTPTGQVLNRILKQYLRDLESAPNDTKPFNIIVITDGVPSDDVESVLISAAKRLDKLDAEPWQVGVQFFQVGEEEGAREHLAALDDELSRMGGGCRDIVDTVPFVPGPRGRGLALTADGILKVVLGAVNRRLDRKRNAHT